MAAQAMKNNGIDSIFVGADRIAANGDTANKIGTYSLAVLANYHKIPFYVAAPLSTVDFKSNSGNDIPVEKRSSKEVTRIKNVKFTLENINVETPAFDITPASLITGIITEKGVAKFPFTSSLLDHKMQNKIKIGIIGGSGMENPEFLDNFTKKSLVTPYGETSSALISGSINKVPVVIVSRHGYNHTINPSNVNYRANIWALKNEGCTHIFALTACGSLREEIKPGDFVFPDQFIDFTFKRNNTFFDNSEVKHTSMGEPYSHFLTESLIKSCKFHDFNFHKEKTVVTIEGPRFSTKAESHMFRNLGCDIINMSTAPEIILARELDLEYQSIAMSTDYDCWRDSQDEVTMDMILSVMKKNIESVKIMIKTAIKFLHEKSDLV